MPMSGRFNEKVKAHLLSNFITTTNAAEYNDPTCFSRAFLDLEDEDPDESVQTTDEDTSSSEGASGEKLKNLLKNIRSSATNLRLLNDATKAYCEGSTLEMLASRLRKEGWDAGVCRTRWGSGGGATAGSYEYVDVVVDEDGSAVRYIVDVGFREGFEVARGSEEYERMVEMVPGVMVGREEEVKEVVTLMAEGARRSLRKQGLSVPPWRKKRYLMAKWFAGDRKRVVRGDGGGVFVVSSGEAVKCREVGFPVWRGASVRLMTRI